MSIFSLFKSRSKTKHKSIVIESKYGIFTSHKFGKNGVVFDGKINWLDDIVDVSCIQAAQSHLWLTSH